MTGELDLALLIGAAVLLIAVAAVRLSTRLGLPGLLVYLLIGMILGEAGLGIEFTNAELTRVLGFCALIVIIAEGGLTARWSTLRPVLGLSAVLATLGVAISVAAVGLAVHLILGLDWRLALLYGAVLSSTDAAAVFATLRRLRLPQRLVATLEAESGMNDAPVVLLVVLLSVRGEPSHPWWYELGLVTYELAAGAAVGLFVGLAGRWLLRHAALPSAGLYPIAAVGLTVLAYAGGAVAHASGFLAVYVAGVVLGNGRLPHRQAILGFADGLAWVAQIGLFVLLGLLVSPKRLPEALVPALVVGTALVLLARPLSVVVCAVAARPFRGPRRPGTRIGWRGSAFLSWAGLRGAVPIVLATIPLSSGTTGAAGLFDAEALWVPGVGLMLLALLLAAALELAARGARVERRLSRARLSEGDTLDVEIVARAGRLGLAAGEVDAAARPSASARSAVRNSPATPRTPSVPNSLRCPAGAAAMWPVSASRTAAACAPS
jgi:cell volume regulation protein A